MIITSCPYRVSFFGGGTDFPSWYSRYGANIISCSIDAFCYVTIRKLLPFYGKNYRISWSKIEEVNNIDSIKHPAIKGALNFLKIKNGLEIHTDGDLPARSGIGSSSSFSASLLLALKSSRGEEIKLRDLTNETIFFEQKILKENVGIQDQIQTCNGGFNLLSINQKGNYRILKLDSNDNLVKNISNKMILLYTGKQRSSSNVQNANNKISIKSKENSLRNISRIADIVKEKILLEDLSFSQFSSYLEESWEYKFKLFPKCKNSEEIYSIYNQAINAGAISGKLLGAGRGGFFLFFVDENNQKQFIEKMSKYTVVKHSITDETCKIIFKSSTKFF